MTRVHTPRQNAKEASDDIDRKIIKCSEDKSLERELRALGKQLVEAKTEADVKKAEHEKKRHEMNKARLDELTESQEARRQLACHDPVHDITKSNFDNTKSREHACGAPANWFGEMGADGTQGNGQGTRQSGNHEEKTWRLFPQTPTIQAMANLRP